MKTFLHQVALHLKEYHGDDFTRICIILPGQRGAAFLRKELVELYNKPFFAPTVHTIETFFQSLTRLSPVSREEQLILLYQIHLEINRKINPEYSSALSDFAPTGETMLSDFNEIDAYLLDNQVVFSSLTAIKELSFFGKTKEELSDFQNNYLIFFKKLSDYYQQFTKKILEQGRATAGINYRLAAENTEAYLRDFPYDRYVFVGFNALTKAEEIVIEHLKEKGKLDYLVDADTFYLNNPLHEAGRFLREFIRFFFNNNHILFMDSHFLQMPKKITMIGVPQAVSQVKIVDDLLFQIRKEDNANGRIAVVAADEHLLTPLLHSIDASAANITMGYPVKETVSYQLISDLLLMLENRNKLQRSNSQASSSESLYFRDLYTFFNHPYVREWIEKDNNFLNLPEKILKNNQIFYSQKDFEALTSAINGEIQTLLFDLLYKVWDGKAYCQLLISFLKEIYPILEGEETEQEIVYQLGKYLLRLQECMSPLPKVDMDTFRFLFEHFIGTVALSFQSDSTAELQIMGVLETRTLDFENVICLSVNEGILPLGKLSNSFIPYDVKQHFRLPTHRAKDAVFAYHFYRLLQRAENVYLVYNLDAKEGKAEKSRFLLQLENELKGFENIQIMHKIITYPAIKPRMQEMINIPKTGEMIAKLHQIQYSASTINIFLSCGLRFYFARILKIEDNSVFGTNNALQSNVIGTAIHYVFEHAVKCGQFVMLTNEEIEAEVLNCLSQDPYHIHAEDLMYEKNHLVFKIIVKYIADYLRIVSRQSGFRVEETEQTYCGSVEVSGKLILLKGIIDRVDYKSGQYCVSDYKSGKVEASELRIKSVQNVFDGKHEKALQLLFYLLLYSQTTSRADMEAQIISMRHPSTPFLLTIDGETKINQFILDEFSTELSTIISQIFNPMLPFSQTTQVENCTFCPYSKICKRK